MDLRIACITLVFFLAGCAETAPTNDVAEPTPATPPASSPEPESPAPEPAAKRTHGDVERTDSSVTTRQDGTRYVASQTVTLSNGAAGATDMSFAATYSVGSLRMTPGHDGYTYELVLEVRADTEQGAREALAQVNIDHADTLTGGTLATATTIGLGPQPVGLLGGAANLRVDFTALVPTLPTDVTVDVSTADLRFDDIRGDTFLVSTSTGDIDGTVHFQDATVTVTTGDIDLDGTLTRMTTTGSTGQLRFDGRMDSLELQRSTGDVRLAVVPGASGAYSFDVSTAKINVDIAGGADRGQDVTARTSTGDLDIDLLNGEEVGPQDEDNAHIRTAGYADKAIQTAIDITTSTGDVDVAN